MRTLLIVLLMCLLVSCASDYTDKAVDRARDYVLDNMKELKESDRDYIKYTPPEIGIGSIMKIGSKESSWNNQIQSTMTWRIPGESDPVIVVGYGPRNFWEWNAVRILRKQPKAPNSVEDTAISSAVRYVMNKMLYLSDGERNRVRFVPPEIRYTDFALKVEEESEDEDEQRLRKITMEERLKAKGPDQYSFVWKADKEGQWIVVSGNSTPGKRLRSWLPTTGQLMDTEELEKHTLPPPPEKEEKKKKSTDEGKSL